MMVVVRSRISCRLGYVTFGNKINNEWAQCRRTGNGEDAMAVIFFARVVLWTKHDGNIDASCVKEEKRWSETPFFPMQRKQSVKCKWEMCKLRDLYKREEQQAPLEPVWQESLLSNCFFAGLSLKLQVERKQNSISLLTSFKYFFRLF